MTVLHNRGKWGASNVVYADGLVTHYDKHHVAPGMEWIDYGLGGLTAQALAEVGRDTRDLADLHRVLAERRLLAGYEVENRFYEIGTPEALLETEEFIRQGAHGNNPGPADL